MEIIVAAVIMLSLTFLTVCQIVKNRKQKIFEDRSTKTSFIVLVSADLILLADMLASGNMISSYVSAMDIMPSVAAVWLLSSFMAETSVATWGVRVINVSNLSLMAFHVCRMAGVAGNIADSTAVVFSSAWAALMMCMFICGATVQMRNVKNVMKNGTVWAFVCIVTDAVYLCSAVAGAALVQMGCAWTGTLVLCGILVAAGYRFLTDSVFVFWRNQERIIVESIKVTSVPSASDGANIDDVYKELYGRVVRYFETETPFLDSELTINDVVKELYSNKLYVSRAISQFTGRNFCQFVNYYRIMHSMECFRENPDLKVHELASFSGFNSIVSYNMAFRLFMGENPSEWCRKERGKLIKKK